MVQNIMDTKSIPNTAAPVTGLSNWVQSATRNTDKLAREAARAWKDAVSTVRVDTPHTRTNYNHINGHPVISRAIDPHTAISSTTVDVCNGVDKVVGVMQHANKVIVPLEIAMNTVRIGSAIYDDFGTNKKKKRPKKTIKTTASVAGGWGGGIGGGIAGAKGGAVAGALIGTLFGGVGVIPGAAIGGLIGSIGGTIGGGMGGSLAAEKWGEVIVDEIFSSDSEDDD